MRALAIFLVTLSAMIFSAGLIQPTRAVSNLFSHVVIIAMENQYYSDVIGNPRAPFINSLASLGSTTSNYHSYGQGINSTKCSAGCYQAFTAGQAIGPNGWCRGANSPCTTAANIAVQMQSAGLQTAMFCEDACIRGADHFPWIGYTNTWNRCVYDTANYGKFDCNGQTGTSGNLLFNSQSSNSGVFNNVTSNAGNTALTDYLNGSNPAQFIWFTPSDAHNMHWPDSNVTQGDKYLKSLLVGTGSVSNPSPGTVLSTNLFRQSSTFLYLWWDEYDPSPNVEYGSMIKAGYVSTGGYTEYHSLHTIEENWALPYLTSVVAGDTSMTDLFNPSVPLTVIFTDTPSSPIVNQSVAFASSVSGGMAPYSYSWSFGDGETSAAANPTHTYTSNGTKNVRLMITDGTSHQANQTQIINVAPPADFTLSATPMQSVDAGAAANYTVTLTPVNGYTGIVNLTVSSSPVGPMCFFTPSSLSLALSRNSIMLCRGSGGQYNITIAATSGSLTHSMSVTLTVRDFRITASLLSLTLLPGETRNTNITLTSIQGLSGNLTVSSSSFPEGLGLDPASKIINLMTGGIAFLSLAIFSTGSTAPGNYNVNVTATSGTVSHFVFVSITVTDPSVGGTTIAVDKLRLLLPYLTLLTPITAFIGLLVGFARKKEATRQQQENTWSEQACQ